MNPMKTTTRVRADEHGRAMRASTHVARSVATIAAVLVASAAAAARGDALPTDAATGECTVAAQDSAGVTCQTCDATSATPGACATRYTGTTFAYRCRGAGASAWTEVWCDGIRGPGTGTGCGYCTAGVSGGPSPLAAAFLAASLIAWAAWAHARAGRRRARSAAAQGR
jgi:hypothetical protein